MKATKVIKRWGFLWLFGHLPWFIKSRLEDEMKGVDAEQATMVSFFGNWILAWPILACLKIIMDGPFQNPFLYAPIIVGNLYWAMQVAMYDFFSRLVVYFVYLWAGESEARPGLFPLELLAGLGYFLKIPYLKKLTSSYDKSKLRDFKKYKSE